MGRRAADAGDHLRQIQFVPPSLTCALDTLVQILGAILESVIVAQQLPQTAHGVSVQFRRQCCALHYLNVNRIVLVELREHRRGAMVE